MNPLAIELNQVIEKSAPPVLDCLSNEGKRFYFPKGILTQSAEAREKAHRFNATIGIATENGEPMLLDVIQDFFNVLEPKDIVNYAPPGGRDKLRALWKQKLFKTNPSLSGKSISTPLVTSALTNGLAIMADLFIGKGDVMVLPDKFWGVYSLNFVTRKGGTIETYPMFNSRNGFNLEGFKDTLSELGSQHKKLLVLLSFPNNPTGYTPSPEEAEAMYDIIRLQAEKGTRLVVVSDDAYFGLFYEDSIQESLFGGFCDIHENVLAVKLDGATKESYAWGFRTGFITFGNRALDSESLYSALESKTKGVIRSTVSSCNHPSQAIVETILQNPDYWDQLQEKHEVLKARALKTKEILSDPMYENVWTAYPFNSGYFMCLRLKHVDAESLRIHLLDNYGIGTIAFDQTDLRIAFSCIEASQLEELFETIRKAAIELEGQNQSGDR